MGLFVLYFTSDRPWPEIARHPRMLNGGLAEELGAAFDRRRLANWLAGADRPAFEKDQAHG